MIEHFLSKQLEFTKMRCGFLECNVTFRKVMEFLRMQCDFLESNVAHLSEKIINSQTVM